MLHAEITNRIVALGDISEDKNINRAWEYIKENVKSSAKESLGPYELKQHKACFGEE